MDRGYDTRSPIQKTSSLPRTFALFRAYMIVSVFLFSVSSFFVIAYAPIFQVRSVEVVGANMTPNENIQIYVAKVLEGNWMSVLPLSSIISVPTKTLEQKIATTFPSVAIAHVERVGLSRVHVSITERVPVYTYCKHGQCVLIDTNDVPFLVSSISSLETVQGSPAEFIRRSASTTNDRVTLGTTLLPQDTHASFKRVRSFLATQGFSITKIQLAPLGFFDIYATQTSSLSQVTFRFRDTRKIDMHIEELRLALEKGLRQKINENTVDYVISYVPQKVIYKNIEREN